MFGADDPGLAGTDGAARLGPAAEFLLGGTDGAARLILPAGAGDEGRL